MMTQNHAAKMLAHYETKALTEQDGLWLMRLGGTWLEVHNEGNGKINYRWGANLCERKTALDALRTFGEGERR